jgi:dynein heavy chain
VQFSKLERIVIGGTKGAALTASLMRIHADFKAAVAAFEGVPYDLLDVEVKSFDADFYGFRGRIKVRACACAGPLQHSGRRARCA